MKNFVTPLALLLAFSATAWCGLAVTAENVGVQTSAVREPWSIALIAFQPEYYKPMWPPISGR
jgi:hypothetical protein